MTVMKRSIPTLLTFLFILTNGSLVVSGQSNATLTPDEKPSNRSNETIKSEEKSNSGKENLKCAESYCLPATYDKLEVPFDENGLVKVSVDFDTLQILEVDDIKFTVMFSMYFGVRWKEPRLVGPTPDDENYYQPIDTGFIKNLWVPDVYLWYLKSIEVLDFLIPFAGKDIIL